MSADVKEIDVQAIDFTKVVAGIDAIRAINPHRFEMELVTAVVVLDPEKKLIVGYKDLGHNEFWARGHMPHYPIMPGVLMCEAAAQLCCYFTMSERICDVGSLMGLGALDETRFHRPVRPGDRLVLVGHGLKVHRRLTRFKTFGYVRGEKVFETIVTGVPIGKWEDLKGA